MTAAPATRHRTAPPATRDGQPVWTSRAGVPFPDLVPRARRRAWVTAGLCPDTDLYALFTGRVREHPDRQALVDDTGVLSYAALDAEVRRIAALFAQEDLGDGDVVALLLPNGRDAVAAELAVYAIGSVALPIPAGGDDRDVRALLARSRARGAVLASARRAQAVADLPHLRTVFTSGSGDGRTHGLNSLPTPARHPWRPRQADPYGPARILVSSGSEAEPKMVAYSHHALVAAVRGTSGACTPTPRCRPATWSSSRWPHLSVPWAHRSPSPPSAAPSSSSRPSTRPERCGRSPSIVRPTSSRCPPCSGASPTSRRGRTRTHRRCVLSSPAAPSAAWPPPRHAVNGSAARW